MVQARRVILDELAAWKPSALEGMAKCVGLIQRQDLATSPALLRVLECRQLFQLMTSLLVRGWLLMMPVRDLRSKFGCLLLHCASQDTEEVVTAGFKWLRAVGDHEFTGVHVDRVFVGGSTRLLTAWIPLGNVPVEAGSLLVRGQLLPKSCWSLPNRFIDKADRCCRSAEAPTACALSAAYGAAMGAAPWAATAQPAAGSRTTAPSWPPWPATLRR